jgi:Zn-dependent protease with chaperone function
MSASHSIEVHLLYGSIVWVAAWLLTSMQRGTATTKYWIWVATSLNFILPLSAVPGRFWPSRVAWFTPMNVTDKFALSARAAALLSALWLLGAVVMLTRLSMRIYADRRDPRRNPSVVGLLRPQISLPEGIDRLLTQRELDAVVIHEVRHAKRRDNLIGLFHEVSLCLLWFHPLVWITSSRLALYRELSCDESVTRRAHSADLVSALAKLASPEQASLLQASASSFITQRLVRLTSDQPRLTHRAANTILAVAFGAILLAAAVGPMAQAAAEYACFLTHGAR